jgi:D-beta-D-heptose 7-phosphate kinase / D-beta-D-heptose 1-phosphate adenosyltransferase
MNDTTWLYCNTIRAFPQKNVLVIGDLILDVYLKGTSSRLSPEAPVPVVDVNEKKILLGGSANTACNLQALGGHVTYCTIVGCDHEGSEAIRLLHKIGINSRCVVRHPGRKTIIKTRVIASGHVITRFDAGTETEADDNAVRELIEFIESTYSKYDAIVISDYDKGVITSSLVSALMNLQEQSNKFIAVDSKRLTFFSDLQPSLVKPNFEEAIRLLDLKLVSSDRSSVIHLAAKNLFLKTRAKLMAVTLDSEGSLIFKNGELVHKAHAPAVSSPHVSGAGDTFLSALTLAYISCQDEIQSAEIATAAATIAILKEDTSSCSNAELRCYFQSQTKCISTLADLEQLCNTYREQGKRIAFTNGCFDILHSGHVTYLHCARKLADVLIVGINNDESIQRIKGKDRPINSLSDRIEVLSGLSAVDHIISFGSQFDDTPTLVIRAVRPNVFVKGGDYTREKLPEADVVEANGGEIIFIPFIPDHSTSAIIQKINSNSNIAASEIIDRE